MVIGLSFFLSSSFWPVAGQYIFTDGLREGEESGHASEKKNPKPKGVASDTDAFFYFEKKAKEKTKKTTTSRNPKPPPAPREQVARTHHDRIDLRLRVT